MTTTPLPEAPALPDYPSPKALVILAFKRLRAEGFRAVAGLASCSLGCCNGDDFAEAIQRRQKEGRPFKGAIWWTRPRGPETPEGRDWCINFDNDSCTLGRVEVGQALVKALTEVGIETTWDGTEHNAVTVVGLTGIPYCNAGRRCQGNGIAQYRYQRSQGWDGKGATSEVLACSDCAEPDARFGRVQGAIEVLHALTLTFPQVPRPDPRERWARRAARLARLGSKPGKNGTKTSLRVKLTGTNGNAFAVMGKVSHALREAGRQDLADQFQTEATAGDYDHLLVTCMRYVEVQ